jgi:hypothetical protein
MHESAAPRATALQARARVPSFDFEPDSAALAGWMDRVGPSYVNPGLDFWNGSAWQRSCSGQVVARDAVLTSAHCFRFFGRPAGNRWSFVVWRQRPNGTWVNHTRTATNGGWMPGTFTLHPQYAGVEQAANTWINHTVKNDVAVLRFEANLVGIDSSDTTYFGQWPTVAP